MARIEIELPQGLLDRAISAAGGAQYLDDVVAIALEDFLPAGTLRELADEWMREFSPSPEVVAQVEAELRRAGFPDPPQSGNA
ncbi:hypothetical protein [Jatrophihabitans fulvus]